MDPEHDRLLERAQRAFRGKPIAQAVPRDRAIIGVKTLPAGETDAQSALDKLGSGEVPTPAEMAALEFMVRLMRPAILTAAGALGPMPSYNNYNQALIGQWNGFRQAVGRFLYSIGRIDREGGGPIGTGFLVAQEVLVTNRHVLHDITFGVDAIGPGQAVVNFEQEWGRPDNDAPIPIVGVVAVEPALDIALLKVARQAKATLVFDPTPVAVGAGVAAVGYPVEDPRNPAFVPSVYDGKFGVKRAAPGEVLGVEGSVVSHDCSTLGGNSGSPVFSLATGRVVGVHRSGTFMYRNQASAAAGVQAFVAPYVA